MAKCDVEAFADRMAEFYLRAEPADLTPHEYVAGFTDELAQSAGVLRMRRFDLPQRRVSAVLEAAETFAGRDAAILESRVREGFVRECHGDLRPEHICLLDPPVVIDCLEFNRRLRLLDPFDELAFLSLECERLGARWVGEFVVERCGRALGSVPPASLRAFYTTVRAMLRARLALAHLLDPHPREPERWIPLARRYLAIAERAVVTIRPR